ncbi:MAG: HYR domain-containing protein [Flavipsychrobacter sp.]
MKRLLSLVTLLCLTVASYAHVWEIRVNQAQNGTLTWYLQSYHTVGQCGIANSGLTINGVNYPLQSEHAGSIAGLSNNVFAVTSTQRARGSYAIVTTPFLGTNLSVQPYSTNACWAFMVGGSGNFTPPPPPVCTTCPITSWSNINGTPNNNGTNCNMSDDYLPTTIKVNHLSCASITGSGKFNVVYDPSGANISYGPYNFSSGISTGVAINLPVGVSNSTQLSVTSSFPCSETHGLSIPGGSFAGVVETVPPSITCPSNKNVVADQDSCSAFINIPQPIVADNCQQPGNSLDFDGANDYVEMPNSSSLNSYVSTGELTIEFWVKPTSVSGNNTVIAHRNNGNSRGLVFEMIGSNKLACYVRAGGWKAIAIFLTPNQWQHVAVVVDASSGMKGYVNGVLNTSKSFNAPFTQSNDVWRIGRNSQSTDPRYFKGVLDEMRIWNTARSESDVRAAMNMELSGSEPGLMAYYDMNHGVAGGNNTSPAVNTLMDKTSNSNNGTLTNFALNNNTSNWVSGSAGVNNITLVNNYNSSSNASGRYPVGTTVVTWTATDENGNTSTCTQNVTVVDDQNPTIACPANVTVNADNGACAATNVSLGTPTTSDNCGVASTTNNAPSSYPVGTTTITWTVTDVHGNTATCTQDVTVVDNQNPTITGPANVTVNADNGACAATNVSLGTPTTGDNCGVASTTNNAPSSYPVGTTTVTWTVTDIHGNTATSTQDVTVVDNQNPTIACPVNVTVNADNGACAATNVSLGTPTTGDNCGVASTTNNAPGSYPVGITTVTWTVTDIHGNTATCTQDVIVIDNQPPTALCKAYTLNLSNGSGTVSPSDVDNGSSDNCGIASMSVSPNAFTCADAGNNNVVLTVTDVHGNTSTCTTTVTVQYQPTCSITTTPSNNIYTGGNPNNIYLGYGSQSATITANATGGSGFTYSWYPAANLSCSNCQSPVFTPTAAGNYTYTVTITNSNGCTTTCTVSFCVLDIRVPGKKGKSSGKVYLCHSPNGNPNNAKTLSVSVNAVASHLSNHSGDKLGACDQSCNAGAKSGRDNGNEGGIAAIEELNKKMDEIKVYPNPNSGTFNIELPGEVKQGEILFRDITGKVIKRTEFAPNAQLRFNMSGIADGIYMIEVQNSGELYRTRVVIRR